MPMNIRIQVQDYQNWSPGIRMAQGEERKLLTAFSHRIAEYYVKELVNAINSQRYKGRWEPLSKDYLDYKIKAGLSPKIWEATSLLKESITYYRSNNSYVIGINPRKMYPNSKVPLYKVCRWMEFGTSRMPARPLFLPIKRKLTRNMRKLWNEFLAENGYM